MCKISWKKWENLRKSILNEYLKDVSKGFLNLDISTNEIQHV